MPTLARTRSAVVIVAASALMAASCGEGTPTQPVPRVGTVQAEWERRRTIALAEIATLGPEHPWAGEYGYALGEPGVEKRLILAPNSGCVAQSHTCLVTIGGNEDPPTMNYGTVSEHEGVIHVKFDRPNDPNAYFGFHTEYTIHGEVADRYLREVPLTDDRWGRVFTRERESTQTIVRGGR